jgi:hypothetical protein
MILAFHPSTPSTFTDLAGHGSTHPTYFDTRARINRLIERYLSDEILSDRLSDLPSQFSQPHQRPWEKISWSAVTLEQIVGMDRHLFVQLIAGAAEIEAPIRSYSQESWDYLQALHPEMAQFVGGRYGDQGELVVVGIWEKEERQHTPALRKIYQQLTGATLKPKPNRVAGYHSAANPWDALYTHLCSRISTEWSAIAVYLWLMAHSTEELQLAIAQLLQDEVNHLAKFWGFSRWAFSQKALNQLLVSLGNITELVKHHRSDRTEGAEVLSLTQVALFLPQTVELGFTFARIMTRIKTWDQELTSSYQRHLFGPTPCKVA